MDINFELPDMCMVHLNDRVFDSKEFIAFIARNTGKVSMYYSTDVLTMGIALKMLASLFIAEMCKTPVQDRREVLDILGPSFNTTDINKLIRRVLNG